MSASFASAVQSDLSPLRVIRSLLNGPARGCRPMSASLIGRLRSSTFRLSAAAVSMSLTGSCFSSESAPRALVWGFFCQEVRQCNACLPSSVSLFDLKAPFLRPDPQQGQDRRAQGAVKVGRRTNLSICFALARPYLDSFEHDGTPGAVGMTIRGEPAFGRGSIAPQPCIR